MEHIRDILDRLQETTDDPAILKELVSHYQEMYVKADQNMRRLGYTMRYFLEMPDDDLTSGE